MDRLPELLAKELTRRRLESKRLPLAIHASVDDNGLRRGHESKYGLICALEQALSCPQRQRAAAKCRFQARKRSGKRRPDGFDRPEFSADAVMAGGSSGGRTRRRRWRRSGRKSSRGAVAPGIHLVSAARYGIALEFFEGARLRQRDCRVHRSQRLQV